MNLTAIFPRFLQVGFQPPHARRRAEAAAALPERRTMPHRTIITLENSRLQLRVLSGCIWITRDNCPADMVLDAGDVFEQRPGARVLVQALEDAELWIAGAGVQAHNAGVAAF